MHGGSSSTSSRASPHRKPSSSACARSTRRRITKARPSYAEKPVGSFRPIHALPPEAKRRVVCADLAFGGGNPVPLTPVGRSLRDARPEVAADAEVGGGRPPDPPRCPPGEGADATGAERVQTGIA